VNLQRTGRIEISGLVFHGLLFVTCWKSWRHPSHRSRDRGILNNCDSIISLWTADNKLSLTFPFSVLQPHNFTEGKKNLHFKNTLPPLFLIVSTLSTLPFHSRAKYFSFHVRRSPLKERSTVVYARRCLLYKVSKPSVNKTIFEWLSKYFFILV
jgi:hypothetical protein